MVFKADWLDLEIALHTLERENEVLKKSSEIPTRKLEKADRSNGKLSKNNGAPVRRNENSSE